MPTYDYQCPKCNTSREVKHPINNPPMVYCDHCAVVMEKRITVATPTQYKGTWFKTKGNY